MTKPLYSALSFRIICGGKTTW